MLRRASHQENFPRRKNQLFSTTEIAHTKSTTRAMNPQKARKPTTPILESIKKLKKTVTKRMQNTMMVQAMIRFIGDELSKEQQMKSCRELKW